LEACLSWVAIESVMVAVVLSFTVIVQLVLAETKDFLTDSDIQGDLKVAMIHLLTLFSRLQSYRIMRVTTENFFKSLVANHY
jgi:hypothetical protein